MIQQELQIEKIWKVLKINLLIKFSKLISGISKKVIFFSFLFINFIEPSKPAELLEDNKSNNIFISQLNWSKISNKNIELNSSKFSSNDFDQLSNYKESLKRNSE